MRSDILQDARLTPIFIVGNIGLGQESVLQLSKHKPTQIYLAARNAAKAQGAIAAIQKEMPDANITFLELDLGSFDSINKAVDEFKDKSQRLDVLMNNAGIMACPPGYVSSLFPSRSSVRRFALPSKRRAANGRLFANAN